MAGIKTRPSQTLPSISGLRISTQQCKEATVFGAVASQRHYQPNKSHHSTGIQMQGMWRIYEAHRVSFYETDLS